MVVESVVHGCKTFKLLVAVEYDFVDVRAFAEASCYSSEDLLSDGFSF